mgnify:CR=1 FL=1
MRQMICHNLKNIIRQELEDSDYKTCRWRTEPINKKTYCHFLANSGCGFWNPECDKIELPQRNEFYPCDLPQMRLKFKGD